LAAGDSDVSERNSVNYGLWAGSYVRGEFDAMRDAAQALLADSASKPHAAEAGVAHRTFGVTQWFAGNFIDARAHLEQALAIFDPAGKFRRARLRWSLSEAEFETALANTNPRRGDRQGVRPRGPADHGARSAPPADR
jgi:hypothetical protein